MRARYPAARARLLVISAAVAVAVTAMPMSATGASAHAATVLYSFGGGSDGANPQGPVVFDSAGNLYGTTTFGGSGDGTVYQLRPSGSGWTKTTLHTFTPATGRLPQGPLAIDAQGNLYGTAYQGGAAGHGVVFRMSPRPDGTWTYRLLYSFTGGTDGGLPTGGVTVDASGNLYGTASRGGRYGQGVVFMLSSDDSGGWTQTVLHHFRADGVDGRHPGGRGALVFDRSGNLYGVTIEGGSANAGVVFQLSPSGTTWTETVLHHFAGGSDGANPTGSLYLDAAGTIYGTTIEGGASGNGTVFRLTRSGATWTTSVIFDFPGGANGHSPYAGVIADPAGNLYGTTSGGAFGVGGVVYQLSPSGGGWTQSVLHTFDGTGSYAGLIRDSAGNLYGTNTFGGPHSAGQVFRVTP
jgi:uncharacterized repeat protein (TIGR03803 family)